MLERRVMIEGKVYGTHEVVLVTHNIRIGETVVTVESASADERIERSTAIALADGLSFAEAEALMWSLPQYAEYVDESTEALNEVLDILTDEQAETVTDLYPEWAVGVAYAVGKRVRYGGKLWRCAQAHTSQEDYTPDLTHDLWVRTSTEEWPEWVQPTGAHDAYSKGDKVTHNGSHWISTYDGANSWEPGVYGWDEVTE